MNWENNNQLMVNDSDRTYLIIAYIAFFIGATFLPLLGSLVGIVMVYMKRQSVWGTIYYNHCCWLIRTFWVPIVCAILMLFSFGLLFWIPFIGQLYAFALMIMSFAISIWYLVRLIYGFIKLIQYQDVNATTWLLN